MEAFWFLVSFLWDRAKSQGKRSLHFLDVFLQQLALLIAEYRMSTGNILVPNGNSPIYCIDPHSSRRHFFLQDQTKNLQGTLL